ncbi:MAG: glycoside hydrolase family 9 protein [Verrucomicrobiota bacterium]|jgi:endoglucanase
MKTQSKTPTNLVRTKITQSLMFGLAGVGLLLLCGSASAGIAVHDGGLFSVQSASGLATISTNGFAVTPGASVMVVALYDNNNGTADPGPFMTWSNTTLGTTQRLTRAVAANTGHYVWTWADLYYLWNPTPGNGVVSGTDTNATAPTAMFMQVYTLSGVDTNATPTTAWIGQVATNLSVNTDPGTPYGSLAAVISVNYNGGGGNDITNTCSSGVAVGYNFRPNGLQCAMGYITNLSAGTSTITASAAGSPGNMDLASAVFAPLLSADTNAVTPQFSNLSNRTNNYGSANVLLTGTVGTTTNFLPNGTAVTASVDGIAQSGGVYDSTGDFSISYDAVGIPASVTPYTVTYMSGIAPGFNSATNTSTTMTVNPLPVVLSGLAMYSSTTTTTVPASDLSVANLVGGDNLTLSGSVTIASTNVGVQTITSFSGLTLGGTAAANYTLTGATGTVTIVTAQANNGITEIRTASPTELVAFFTFTNVSGPWYNVSYPTNLVTTSSPGSWKLNGTPVQAISGEFVTEDEGSLLPGAKAVEYHIYLQVPQLVNGTFYTLVTPYSTNSFVFQDSQILCESIKVNQSGYSALSTARYANFAIWLGTGGASQISGPLPNYTVINAFTGQQVASGTLQTVTTAQPDTSSGDYVYRIDLSGVPAGGPYRIVVSGCGSSYPFGVGGDFSHRLAYVAFRALYYQRCGCPIVKPYAWADIRPYPCHTNIYDNQSPNAPSSSSINVSTSGPKLFLHGGYHDAGDTQKNPCCLEPAMALMTAYEVFPGAFTTNQFNIPATFDANYNITGGYNGIPDVLNEVNWGLMLFTNLQSTPNEPVGVVGDGTASNQEPLTWGINWDQDILVYSTITNQGWESSWAACAFMNFARLIKPYDSQLASVYAADAVAAYNAPGSHPTFQHQLYYNVQKYLWDGDLTASNNIESVAWRAAAITNTYDDEASGFAFNNSQIWMASEFMSYIIATNFPTDPNLVSQFKTYIQMAADRQVGYVNGDAYPVGWPTNVNPYTQNNYAHGPLTSQGEYAFPCLMAWALTGQQKYINAASVLMDYDQGLNPLGKCYMTGMGFNRVHNPHQGESYYAELQGWGGPQPGISIYGPGQNNNSYIPPQIPAALSLPREREWVDDVGNYQWSEFTDYQSEGWPAAVYPVLAQSGVWSPVQGEPFLYQGASISPNGSGGYVLQFGGIPYQTYYLQSATNLTGPWSTVSGSVVADVTGTVRFTDTTPATTTKFYRSQGSAPIY